MAPRYQIVTEIGPYDGDGNIVVTLMDPPAILEAGDLVAVRDDKTGQSFTGTVVDVHVDDVPEDGIVRVDLRIQPR